MRRLKAIFPFPRRLRGWLHLQGIPGTELEPPEQQPGEPTDPGIVCDIEIISYETLNAPTGQEIKVATFIMNEEAQFLISIEEHDGEEPVFRLLDDQNEVVHDWQEETEFLLPFNSLNNNFVIQMKNKWQEISDFSIIIFSSLEEEFEFTGEVEEIIIPFTGIYEVELWGAEGGGQIVNHGGKGGYVKGKLSLIAGDIVQIRVGEKGKSTDGEAGQESLSGGWNGGGMGGQAGNSLGFSGCSGGGATDIRVNGHDLEHRKAVAGAGAGGTGSGTIVRWRDGNSGGGGGYYGGGAGNQTTASTPGTQESGGSLGGLLGYGGDAAIRSSTSITGTTTLNPGGDGGGLEGTQGATNRSTAGSGGSSYIDELIDGETETGIREGDGLAKIKYLGFPDLEIDNVQILEDTEYTLTFDVVGALGSYETRIIHDGSPYNGEDWGTDTEFTFPLAMENEVVTIEVKDVRDVIVAQAATIEMIVYEEFEATSTEHEGTIQLFEAPFSGTYKITAYGAGWGGDHQKGAKISGEFFLTEGEKLDILVGQLANNAWSGCGGTFVVKENGTTNDDILVIAGGNGGYSAGSPEGASHGQAGTAGGRSTGTASVANNGDGGVQSGSTFAGSGAGFFGNGEGTDTGVLAQSYINGGNGQISQIAARGGYGGGGTGRANDRIGGGGGYSGGTSHGGSAGYGGGGGSFNSGTDQENESGVREGHGKVEIELIALA